MRYSLIAAFVGAAVAAPYVETVYDTKVYTVTSCGPDVVDCPGKKTSAVATTTTCTDEVKKPTTVPVVYVTTSSAKPVESKPVESKPVESKPVETTPCPTTTLVVKTSAPAPPPKGPETYPAPPPKGPETHPAPPPYHPVPTGGVATTPAPSASTGVVPYKTTSAYATKTTQPAVYTGAASHVQVAGLVGAGAIAAFFL